MQAWAEDAAIRLVERHDIDSRADEVAEGTLGPADVGVTVHTVDPDGDPVRYGLLDDPGGLFAIDPASGILTPRPGALPNYQAATSHIVRIAATDKLGRSQRGGF